MNILAILSIILNLLLIACVIYFYKCMMLTRDNIPQKRGNMMARIMDSANVRLWKYEPKTNLIYYADESFTYDRGISLDEHLMLKPEEDRQLCRDHIKKLSEDPTIKNSLLRYRYIDPSSHSGFRYINCFMYIDREADGKIKEIFSFEQDVTPDALRTLQAKDTIIKTQEASRNKSLFVANASHDIRTPLNGIVGFTQLLRYEDDEKERESLYDSIEECSSQLLSLINDILDVSKIEAGKVEYCYTPLHLRELMTDLLSTYNVQKTEAQTITLHEPPSPTTIVFDRQRFIQIVNNFMSNAMKFTEAGEISITYRYNPTDGFYLEVKDSGLGIREENKPRIFMQFQKLNQDHQGTGLGLSICKQIVESQGGKIGFVSELGKGSTFWFSLPASVCAPQES